MRICPFCKQSIRYAFPFVVYLKDEEKWSFLHHCLSESCHRSVLIVADTKADLLMAVEREYPHEEVNLAE